MRVKMVMRTHFLMFVNFYDVIIDVTFMNVSDIFKIIGRDN